MDKGKKYWTCYQSIVRSHFTALLFCFLDSIIFIRFSFHHYPEEMQFKNLFKNHKQFFSKPRFACTIRYMLLSLYKYGIIFSSYSIRIEVGIRILEAQSTYIHLECHSVCPPVGIGTPPIPLPQASVYPLLNQRGGTPSPAGEGVGES